MRELHHVETLVFYDKPELFIAQDKIGMSYVCILVEIAGEADTYLCVPVSEGRRRQLLAGDLDLRQVFEAPETEEAYAGLAIEGDMRRIQTRLIPIAEIGEAWLPATGIFLEPEPLFSNEVVTEAHRRRRAVVDLTLRPPESWAESSIAVTHLSQGLRLFQSLIANAYRKALRRLDSATRTVISGSENYELQVLGTSPGSFTVHMQAAIPADLVGYSQVAKALEIVDRISLVVDDPPQALNLVAEYGGHFAVAFKRLLLFIRETDTPVAYEWSMPGREDSTKREIATRFAGPLYDVLAERLEIGMEQVRLEGTVSKVDVDTRTWRIVDEESGHPHSGACAPGVSLAGIVIKEQRYEFICEEQLEEEAATGREYTKLYLTSWRPL
jgi:hypothetical protein